VVQPEGLRERRGGVQAVRQGFVDAIAFAEAGDWGAIEDIAAIHSGPALVTKTLSMYFPSELLPINSQAHLRHFLQALGTRALAINRWALRG